LGKVVNFNLYNFSL